MLKMKYTRFLTLAVAVTIMLCCTGCGNKPAGAEPPGEPSSESAPADGKTYTLSWAGIGSTDAIDTWIGEEAARRISEQTDGHVEIKVYPASQLGDLTQAYDEIIAGTIDMGLFTVYGTYDIVNEINFTCFLTSSLDEFREVYSKDGFIYQTLEQAQRDRGVTLMGFWPSGYLGLGFAKLSEGPDTLFDCTVKKNELIRVPGMDTMLASAQALGYNTTTINYSDVYTSLQTGVCDGSWNGGAYANYQSFRDVLKYYVDYRVCNDVYSMVMNTQKLASLPAEYQEIVTSVIGEVLEEGITKIGEQETQSLKDLADYGIEVIVPTDEQRDEMKAYFVENVWPTFADMFGQDVIDKLVETAAR